jgi:O-methyltransferase
MDNSDEEPILAARLEWGTATLDEALRLRALVANRGAPFPLNWEEKTLRLALAAEPGRSDLAQRLQVVIRQQIEPDAALGGELDHQLESAKYHLKTALADMDPAFLPLYEGCKAMTMTSPERMFALFKAIEYVVRAGIEGDIVECGVWRGGSMMAVAYALSGVLLIDDYGAWTGAKKAVDEYIDANRLPIFLHNIDGEGRIALKMA